jgi:protein-tyrosine phosphatase
MKHPQIPQTLPYRILFVCRGNTCRSPMAEAVFAARAAASERIAEFAVASAGVAVDQASTGADPRAVAACARRSVVIANHRCRQVTQPDFSAFDLILAADHSVMTALIDMAPAEYSGNVRLAMDLTSNPTARDIPDPWSGDAGDYDHALDLIERVVDGVLAAYPPRPSNGNTSSTA